MRRLNDTIAHLRAATTNPFQLSMGGSGRLTDLATEDSNPGALKAKIYVPERTHALPLVVVLHGCTQTAAGYDHGSGWSGLAEEHGFAVLLPEQQRTNNPNLCFNWFLPSDARRDRGEALSIRQMIATMVERYGIDPSRVFVTGLSAGGAMTSVMLASYPEVFAAGAIIAGLPFGAADTMPQALERMRGQGHADAVHYATLVRSASDYRGRWPAVSVWHGDADMTVVPGNAEAILGQWHVLHGVSPNPDRREIVDGAIRRQWLDDEGRVCVEDYRIPGMGHGTPLGFSGAKACGSPMPHMLDVGISSTWHIAAGWNLLDPGAEKIGAADIEEATPAQGQSDHRAQPSASSASSGVQDTIEAALRSAGLMR